MTTAPIRMAIESTPAHLPVVRAAVESLCLLIGFDPPAAGRAVAAVDEALANIIAHAYEGRPGQPIEVTLIPLAARDGREGLEVQLYDRGRVVEPEAIGGRELEDIRPGGLGTHIMGCCMDVVEYKRPAEGGTRLRMVKYLSACGAGASGGGEQRD